MTKSIQGRASPSKASKQVASKGQPSAHAPRPTQLDSKKSIGNQAPTKKTPKRKQHAAGRGPRVEATARVCLRTMALSEGFEDQLAEFARGFEDQDGLGLEIVDRILTGFTKGRVLIKQDLKKQDQKLAALKELDLSKEELLLLVNKLD